MAAIKGIEQFQRHFAGFEDQYVLIGGVACHLWFQDNGLNFRATKDLDVVLVAEALTDEFVQQLWAFVKAGRYRRKERSDQERRYYRFADPQDAGFPHMIELFSRLPDGLDIPTDQTVAPIPTNDDVSSLSAILLNEEYYQLIREHRQVVEDLPLVTTEVLISLKAKAWLDLTERRKNGEAVDSNHIAKHRSDVFRLALLLQGETKLMLPDTIAQDLKHFLDAFPADSPEWPAIGASLKAINKINLPAVVLREAIADVFNISIE